MDAALTGCRNAPTLPGANASGLIIDSPVSTPSSAAAPTEAPNKTKKGRTAQLRASAVKPLSAVAPMGYRAPILRVQIALKFSAASCINKRKHGERIFHTRRDRKERRRSRFCRTAGSESTQNPQPAAKEITNLPPTPQNHQL